MITRTRASLLRASSLLPKTQHQSITMSTRKKKVGHAAHMQDSEAASLAGKFTRQIKLTMLGAGSEFTPRLVNDILRTPGQQGGIIALVDIDSRRLKVMKQIIDKLVGDLR